MTKKFRRFSLLLAMVMMLSLVLGSLPVGAESQEDSADTITVTDHMDNTVEVPKEINRIVVCDIYPLPSVLSVFFDSAEKIVGMAEPSMTAAVRPTVESGPQVAIRSAPTPRAAEPLMGRVSIRGSRRASSPTRSSAGAKAAAARSRAPEARSMETAVMRATRAGTMRSRVSSPSPAPRTRAS